MTDDLDAIRAHLNIALEGSTLVGALVNESRRTAYITLAVLSLPEKGLPPDDPRVQLQLAPVGRVCASLREGRWDAESSSVRPFVLSQLMDVVRSFKESSLSGWDFFDSSNADQYATWSQRPSLDVRLGSGDGERHTLDLFQEWTEPERRLDIRFWFDELHTFRPAGDGTVQTSIESFARDGKRWWDGLHSGDARTAGHGIYPGRPTPEAIRRVLESLDKPRGSGPH